MAEEMIVCARPGCGVMAEKKTHNQKYCSSDCCRVETNRKIMEKYHHKAAIRRGEKRVCSTCRTTVLSKYNELNECAGCISLAKNSGRQSINELLSLVNWS